MEKLIGNAVVGQSGGPTAAINATLSGVIRGVLDESCHGGAIKTLYGMKNGVEGLLAERLVNLNEIFSDEQKLTDLENTPAAALGSCRKKLPSVADGRETYEKLLEIFKKYDIRYFFYIGGNDSMDTAAKLSEFSKICGYEMRIIGVPKTIDNDLIVTDHTPGFGSAAKYIGTTVREIIRDCAVYTVKAVTIVEIMGRDAGWLTCASALGRAVDGFEPDLVYLPERDFDADKFICDVRAALERHPNVVVAVSEGIKSADGKYVCELLGSGSTDVFGHTQLTGCGKALEHLVKREIGCKVRSIELNLPQRCASHLASKTDLCESVLVGRGAVKAASEGVTCHMMTILRKSTTPYEIEISSSDVSLIANQAKSVPDEFINAEGNHVTDECVDYLLPLIEGENTPRFEKGLPAHVII